MKTCPYCDQDLTNDAEICDYCHEVISDEYAGVKQQVSEPGKQRKRPSKNRRGRKKSRSKSEHRKSQDTASQNESNNRDVPASKFLLQLRYIDRLHQELDKAKKRKKPGLRIFSSLILAYLAWLIAGIFFPSARSLGMSEPSELFLTLSALVPWGIAGATFLLNLRKNALSSWIQVNRSQKELNKAVEAFCSSFSYEIYDLFGNQKLLLDKNSVKDVILKVEKQGWEKWDDPIKLLAKDPNLSLNKKTEPEEKPPEKKVMQKELDKN